MRTARPFYVPVVSGFYVSTKGSSRNWFENKKTIQLGNEVENEVVLEDDDNDLEYYNEGVGVEIKEVNHQFVTEIENENKEGDDDE